VHDLPSKAGESQTEGLQRAFCFSSCIMIPCMTTAHCSPLSCPRFTHIAVWHRGSILSACSQVFAALPPLSLCSCLAPWPSQAPCCPAAHPCSLLSLLACPACSCLAPWTSLAPCCPTTWLRRATHCCAWPSRRATAKSPQSQRWGAASAVLCCAVRCA
jgi:hypothetical protein